MAVVPSLFLALTSAPFWTNSVAISCRPRNAAECKEVDPSRFLELTLAPRWMSSSAVWVCSRSAAQDRGVIPYSPPWALISAPLANCCLIVSMSPEPTADQISLPVKPAKPV